MSNLKKEKSKKQSYREDTLFPNIQFNRKKIKIEFDRSNQIEIRNNYLIIHLNKDNELNNEDTSIENSISKKNTYDMDDGTSLLDIYNLECLENLGQVNNSRYPENSQYTQSINSCEIIQDKIIQTIEDDSESKNSQTEKTLKNINMLNKSIMDFIHDELIIDLTNLEKNNKIMVVSKEENNVKLFLSNIIDGNGLTSSCVRKEYGQKLNNIFSRNRQNFQSNIVFKKMMLRLYHISTQYTCQEKDCNNFASFSQVDHRYPLFCSNHKKNNMINYFLYKCEEKNCNEIATRGYFYERFSSRCILHKKPYMKEFCLKQCNNYMACNNHFYCYEANSNYYENLCITCEFSRLNEYKDMKKYFEIIRENNLSINQRQFEYITIKTGLNFDDIEVLMQCIHIGCGNLATQSFTSKGKHTHCENHND